MIIQNFKVDIENNFIHRLLSETWDQAKEINPELKFHYINNFQLKLSKVIYKILNYFNWKVPNLKKNKEIDYYIFFLGPDFGKLIFPKIMGYRIKPVMMDAWELYHDNIEKAIKIFDLKEFYFSSSQVAEKFKKKFPDRKIAWLPEAVKIKDYSIVPYHDRSIDLFSFGRNNIEYYNKIKTLFIEKKINSLIQEPNKPLILPSRKDFDKALKNAKISICFPGSITNPEKYQGIETVTWRYFQCMASKVIILGKAPKELTDLFGYNPVIEIDNENPINQIIEILNQPEKHLTLVEKNYNTTKLHHQWKNRIQTIQNQN